jgi:hypothetical protein
MKMDKRMFVTMLGIVALAIVAAFEKSVEMFVSAAAIAVIVYVFHQARMRDRVIGIIAAGLGGSIGAAIVRTFYHYAAVAAPAGDSSGFFMSAIVIGVINASAIIVVILCTESALRVIGRKDE